MKKADIGLIGLAVMGQNLVLNMNDHSFTVAVFNRTVSKVDEFLNGEARGTHIIGAHSLEELISLLKKPRYYYVDIMNAVDFSYPFYCTQGLYIL
jgi:6-phosphogluconate dehydrogenase